VGPRSVEAKPMTRLVRAVALVCVLFAIVAARVVWSSRGEWRAAVAATGDDEIMHLGRAARLYAPGNPYSRRAVEKLAAIGRAEHNDLARALAASRELRSACLATRSFYTPHRALYEEANARIADLMAAADTSKPDARAWHAARLAQDESPSLAWTLVALAGLVLWIGSALGLLLRGIGDDDRLQPRRALAWALALAAGLALFFLGLARA
jgi:hypothetical protein